MASFKARQIAAITDAIAAARHRMREQKRFEPLLFAEVFVANDGVQIPGDPGNTAEQRRVADELLVALAAGRTHSTDPHVARELGRAVRETEWARAMEADNVVGFALRLTPAAEKNPNCKALLKADNGLGAGIYRKYAIVIPRPECEGCSFVPVHDHEVEC